MSAWWERAEAQIEDAYAAGNLSRADYNAEMRELGAEMREMGVD